MPSKRSRSKSSRKPAKNRLKVLSSKVVYNGKVFKVTSDEITEPTGITARRDIIRHSGSVVVLAVDETGAEPRVLLERQYRYAARDYLWELPAGRIDPGETAAGRGQARVAGGDRLSRAAMETRPVLLLQSRLSRRDDDHLLRARVDRRRCAAGRRRVHRV